MGEKNSKLNIAMICDPIGNNKSGVVVSTLRFSKLLKERGHHVIFIGAQSKEHKDTSDYDGIRAYRYRSLPIPKSGGWHLAFPTVRELKKVFKQENINIVHIILPMSGALVAIKAARELDIKIVAHSHSQPENLFADMPKIIQPALNSLWNNFLIWIYGKADLLIYPTEMAKELLDNLNKKHRNSVVISNGINLKHFYPMPVSDFYSKFNIPTNTTKLLFVGRLFPEKSIDTLLKALPYILAKNPNTYAMIVGGGHLKSKLEKLTKDIGIEKNVNFLGIVSEEDKVHAYNACDVFILPSIAELEGMVVLEAMACGKPIIISDSKMSASRFFVEKNGFLFKNKNPRDLADKISTLVLDAALRNKMGETSLELVKKYDIQKSVLKLENAYRSVLE